jgi:hypothetical protein
MIRRIVQERVAPPESEPQTFERRAFVRYPRRLESFWQLLGVRTHDLASAEVSDLSMAGLALTVEQAFGENTILVLRLPTATLGWNTHLVRVKHCERIDEKRFRIGCAFVKPLSVGQFQSLMT